MKHPTTIFTTFSFLLGISAGCLVTNHNHCGINNGSCDAGYFCSVCEVENNGCVEDSKVKEIEKDCIYPDATGGMTTSSSSLDSTSTGSTSTSESTSTSGLSFESTSETTFETTSISSEGSSTGSHVIVCGDGVVDFGEYCDDGNDSQNDDCTNECKVSICGDGFVNLEKEECDDGNDIKEDDCSNSCELPKLIFVSSQKFKGNFFPQIGDFTGSKLADKHCNELATDQDIEGVFVALISNNIINLSEWSIEFKGSYKLVDGTVIVKNGFLDLFTENVGLFIEDAINITEDGNWVEELVWTGTLSDGLGKNNCDNWSSDNFIAIGVQGWSGLADKNWIEADENANCAASARIYCIQL